MILLKQMLYIYFFINLKGARKHHSLGSDVFRTVVDGTFTIAALFALIFGLDKVALICVIARFVILLPLIWYFIQEEKAPPETMETWQRELSNGESEDKFI